MDGSREFHFKNLVQYLDGFRLCLIVHIYPLAVEFSIRKINALINSAANP